MVFSGLPISYNGVMRFMSLCVGFPKDRISWGRTDETDSWIYCGNRTTSSIYDGSDPWHESQLLVKWNTTTANSHKRRSITRGKIQEPGRYKTFDTINWISQRLIFGKINSSKSQPKHLEGPVVVKRACFIMSISHGYTCHWSPKFTRQKDKDMLNERKKLKSSHHLRQRRMTFVHH